MAGPGDASWQLTLATVITGAGVLITGGLTIYNLHRTSASKRLDHYNSVIRRPIEVELARVGLCVDNAEDFTHDPSDPPATLKQIWREFNGARRNLERLAQYAQAAESIPGYDWVSFQDDASDQATEALDAALSAFTAGDRPGCNAHLGTFRTQADRFRGSLLKTVDRNAKSYNSFWDHLRTRFWS